MRRSCSATQHPARWVGLEMHPDRSPHAADALRWCNYTSSHTRPTASRCCRNTDHHSMVKYNAIAIRKGTSEEEHDDPRCGNTVGNCETPCKRAWTALFWCGHA